MTAISECCKTDQIGYFAGILYQAYANLKILEETVNVTAFKTYVYGRDV